MTATYEISYHGSDQVSHASGKTASAAKYNHFLRVGDCFDSFREFLKSVEYVRKVPHVVGAYDFIERQYGVRFEVGDIVTVRGEGSIDGTVGEVLHPGSQGAYVTVLIDGNAGLFHPSSLISASNKTGAKP